MTNFFNMFSDVNLLTSGAVGAFVTHALHLRGKTKLASVINQTVQATLGVTAVATTSSSGKVFNRVALATPAKPMKRVSMIDVSGSNGVIDWKQVATQHSIAYCKLTEGTELVDKANHHTFPNLLGMKAVGIERGGYHYFRFDVDPIEQAEWCVKVASACGYEFKVDHSIALDLEDRANVLNFPYATRIAMVDSCLKRIDELTGRDTILYADADFLTEYIGDAFVHRRLWFPHLSSDLTTLPVPPLGYDWVFWQYSWNGRSPGINGDVDLSMVR